MSAPRRPAGSLRGALLGLLVAAAPAHAEVLASPEFRDAFEHYYAALAGFGVPDLRFELAETIEDALSSGGHLSQLSLDDRTRHIEARLLERLRGGPCGGGRGPLKRAAVRSAAGAGADAGVRFTDEELGMIAGVVVRLVEGAPRLCG